VRSTSVSRIPKPRSAIEVLLEAFAWHTHYVPPVAHVLASADELPPPLQARACTLDRQSSWRAWTDDVRFWCLAGRLCGPRHASGDVLALEISFFDPDGRLVAVGEWALQSEGHWALRRVIDSGDRVHHRREVA
jgi:hypothetical protein